MDEGNILESIGDAFSDFFGGEDLDVCPVLDPNETKEAFLGEAQDYCAKLSDVFQKLEAKGVYINPGALAYAETFATMDIQTGAPDYPKYDFNAMQENLRGLAAEYGRAVAAAKNM